MWLRNPPVRAVGSVVAVDAAAGVAVSASEAAVPHNRNPSRLVPGMVGRIALLWTRSTVGQLGYLTKPPVRGLLESAERGISRDIRGIFQLKS
jgi:hypothetical protein